MTFVRLHKKLDNSQLAALLMTQTCQEDRLKMAVDLSLGLMEMKYFACYLQIIAENC